MKNLLVWVFLFCAALTFAQFNTAAPWMDTSGKKSANKKVTFKNEVNTFNQYWQGKDNTKKGSGYKPFKRWENHWKNYLIKDGSIATPKWIQKAWLSKQKLNKSVLSNWQTVGPFTTNIKSGQGRVNTFIVDPNNSNIFYVGTPSGGIWKSINSGLNWVPLSDQLPQIGVSGIAIDPNNSDVIYIATGDDDANDTYSIGVLKSIDGGETWNTTGLVFTDTNSSANEIYIHPNNSNIIWVATSNGFYKSIDAGVSFKLNDEIYLSVIDIKIHPANPDIIYAVTGSTFFRSIDGGDVFTEITEGVPKLSSRLAIEVSIANPDIVYLLSAKRDNTFQGLYKSMDSGMTFEKTEESNDIFGGSTQAWYDMALTVSQEDANIVFVGVLDIWGSTDGGDHFVQKNNWWNPGEASYTHADIHFLRYFNKKLYAGTDGGIYESSDDATSFHDLTEGLNISQYYRIATSKNSAANIVGGLQDNGGFAYNNNKWYNYHGADGMDCAVDPNDKNIYYGFTQYGGVLNIAYDGGKTPGGRVAYSPSGENGSWVTPLEINKNGVLYAGYSKLYKLVNNNWQVVSSDGFGGNLDHIAIAATNPDIIFVSRSGELFKSVDGGVTFGDNIFDQSGEISSISINHQNEDVIYITTRGFEGKVYKSFNGGSYWEDISGNLPKEPKLVIKHQNQSIDNDLYLGTILGVYHTNDMMTDWEVFDTNLPNVPVSDIAINIEDKIVTVGTYGRGVWQSPIEVKKVNIDIGLLEINTNNSIQCNGVAPIITVKNTGKHTLNKVIINYDIDGESFQYVYENEILADEIKKIQLPSHNSIAIGKHELLVKVNVNNDTFADNNQLKATFTTNNTSTSAYLNTFGEVNPDEWLVQTLGISKTLWKKAKATTPKFKNKLNNAYITNPTGHYSNTTTSYLISPCYNLSIIENPILKFDMIFDIELEWDVLYMEYSVNSGESWEILGDATDENWYNSSFIDIKRPITVGAQWTGLDTDIKTYQYDLSLLKKEKDIVFRFVFASDEASTAEGAAIDNFVIEGNINLSVDNWTQNSFKIYPNPSTDSFYIERLSGGEMAIDVYGITGKLIFSDKNIFQKNYTLNLAGVDAGVYFLKITEGEKRFTKRLLVR